MNTTIYAGFWRRCIAFVVDGLLVSLVPAVVFIPLLVWRVRAAGQATPEALAGVIGSLVLIYILWQVVAVVFWWLYFACLESGPRQATLGKRLLKIKVIGKNGERIGFGRATGRVFAKILSYITLNFGYIMAGLTNRKRALHDYVAETYVVKAEFQPGDDLPDTPSHKGWMIAIAAILVVGMGVLFALGVFAQQPAGMAFQAAAQLQTLAAQQDLPYGPLPAGNITYYHYSDGYHAVFEDADGGEYALYLPAAGEEVCCENYPGDSCEATGYAECE